MEGRGEGGLDEILCLVERREGFYWRKNSK